MTILTSVMQFAMLPLSGLAQGAQPISSYNYGAKNADRVKKIFKLLLTVSLIYSATLWACVMLFPQVFVGIFTPKPELIDFGSKALRVYLGVMLIFGAQIACQMTFISLGNAKSSILVAIVRKFILLLPLIFIMPQLMENKSMAVYAAEPVADILAVSFTVILFAFQFKKALRKLEE
jgi:Na+-driven multidrug efflux pump